MPKIFAKIILLIGLFFVAIGVFPNAIELSNTIDTISSNQVIYPTEQITTTANFSTPVVFRPEPLKAVWYATVVPGLGQFYNRKYWKLPILYGGALGLTYAITWNGGMYRDYQKAYRDIVDDDPSTQSYLNVLPQGVIVDNNNKTYYTGLLKNKQDNYLRNRDLSIIGTVGLYVLSIVDAYVDAHLYDFDISPDLSMKIAPSTIPTQPYISFSNIAFGLSCTINF